MDRKLTESEREQYRQSTGNQRKNSSAANRKRLRRTIVATALSIFLCMPTLVDFGLESFGFSTSNRKGSHLTQSDEPVIQVYAARTWGLKGLFAVHTWIAMKRQGSNDFEVIQVIGWRGDRQGNVLFREANIPIDSWWGNEATLILDLKGEHVTPLINQVDAAISQYPWKQTYQLYPGPNSNTFTAWIGLQVPELGLDLPSTAIGKDWRPLHQAFGSSASGTGLQASLYGLLGGSVGFEEGLELNVLGLNFEIDLFDLAIEVPMFGRYESWYLVSFVFIWFFMMKLVRKLESKIFEAS